MNCCHHFLSRVQPFLLPSYHWALSYMLHSYKQDTWYLPFACMVLPCPCYLTCQCACKTLKFLKHFTNCMFVFFLLLAICLQFPCACTIHFPAFFPSLRQARPKQLKTKRITFKQERDKKKVRLSWARPNPSFTASGGPGPRSAASGGPGPSSTARNGQGQVLLHGEDQGEDQDQVLLHGEDQREDQDQVLLRGEDQGENQDQVLLCEEGQGQVLLRGRARAKFCCIWRARVKFYCVEWPEPSSTAWGGPGGRSRLSTTAWRGPGGGPGPSSTAWGGPNCTAWGGPRPSSSVCVEGQDQDLLQGGRE